MRWTGNKSEVEGGEVKEAVSDSEAWQGHARAEICLYSLILIKRLLTRMWMSKPDRIEQNNGGTGCIFNGRSEGKCTQEHSVE